MTGVAYDRIFVLSQWHTGINILRIILINITNVRYLISID